MAVVGQNVGYIRVSSVDQNEERQIEGIKAAGIPLDKTFIDKLSGKDTKRPALAECLRYMREGDTLICHSIDRLARNLRDLQEIIDGLQEKNVAVRFIKEALHFSADKQASPMQTLTLQLLGAFAQFERTLIRERQREGIALVRARGGKLGRGHALKPEEEQILMEKLKAGIPKVRIASDLNVSRQTVHRYAKTASQKTVKI